MTKQLGECELSEFDFDKFNDEYQQDIALNFGNLNTKLFELPGLHSKYLKIFYTENKKLQNMEKSLAKLYKDKYHYYTFEFDKKMESAKETEFHVLADPEYAVANRKVKQQKLVVACVERALKRVENMGFDTKTIVEYLKYVNGV